MSKSSWVHGCMFGLAIGDALGWPVEFSSTPSIFTRYGLKGVTNFLPGDGPPYIFTDDTQMSLSTAWGLIDAAKEGHQDPIKDIYKRYLEWLDLQSAPGKSRAPGGTCLSALRSGKMGSIGHPLNDSKGCGGVMRTAPVGLVYSDAEDAFEIGARAAALTHGHPSGYLPAGVLAAMISQMVVGRTMSDALSQACRILRTYSFYEETACAIMQALELAQNDKDDITNIHALGGGWVGEEALAISLYCAKKYSTNFQAALCAAVTHNGDSDSTGSITGAILGAHSGTRVIPTKWLEGIEDHDVLLTTSDALVKIYR